MARPVIEVNQEIVEPTPRCIREVCVAAGADGWQLAGMLAVMLPPTAKKRQQRRIASGLLLSESVTDEKVNPALAAQLEAADGQPVPAVMLMFQREADSVAELREHQAANGAYQADATFVGERPILRPLTCPFQIVEATTWARSVPGWMTLQELTWIAEQAARLPPGGQWVEVGSWFGRSFAAALLAATEGATLSAVDHWLGAPDWPLPIRRLTGLTGPAALAFRENAAELRRLRPGVRQRTYEGESVATAEALARNSLDAVFIDGSHDPAGVRADLEAWIPKLRPGGLLCGHDAAEVAAVLSALVPGWQVAAEAVWHWRKP